MAWPAQHRPQPGIAQPGVLAATGQLEQLDDELHFANAAGTELEVVGRALGLGIAVDQALQLAQGIERAVVEVAAVDERPQAIEQRAAGGATR